MIIEKKHTHKINWIKSKENNYASLHILKILSKNKYFLFFKIKFIYIKNFIDKPK